MWKAVSIVLTVVCALLLVRYSHTWHETPIPGALGTFFYEFEATRERAAVAAALLTEPTNMTLPVPVVGVRPSEIADTFGEPRGQDRGHQGVDIFAPRGTYIVSATPGIVVRIGTNNLGGNVIFILGPGGERYYYAHLDAIDPLLSQGQIVSTTTLIGLVGTSGNAEGTPPHLHFGIYGSGGAENPYERFLW